MAKTIRYIKIKLEVDDDDYILAHRQIRKVLDEAHGLHSIKSWRYIEPE